MKLANALRSVRLPLSLGVLALAASAAGAVQAAPAAPNQTCPAADFTGFFRAFSDSRDVQRAFTAESVAFTETDAEADPEPMEVTVNRPHAAIEFPVVPTLSDQRRDGLESTVSRTEDGMMRVRLQKPDTGYQLLYIFKPRGDCWELYAAADNSF